MTSMNDTVDDTVMDVEIATDGMPELLVRGHSGDITIGATQSSTIRVHLDGYETRHHHPVIEPEIVSQSGNRVTIDTHQDHGMLHADLNIEVPISTAISVNTVDGDIGIHDVQGPIELSTVDGDIHFNHARGVTKITTVGGDVHGERLDGTLTLQTTNGDVKIRHSTLLRFNVHSVNGDLMIETPLVHGEHYFAKTANGDIQLWIPATTGATVQMNSSNGEFHCDLPAEVINSSRRHWQGRINGGGANVELETLNGDVRIRQTPDADVFASDAAQLPHLPEMPHQPDVPEYPAIADMPDLPDLPHPGVASNGGSPKFDEPDANAEPSSSSYTGADSIDILARLERGEITVEEAMEGLDSLR